MTQVIIRTDQVEGFFDRARKVAQKADRGESLKKSATISFEDLSRDVHGSFASAQASDVGGDG